MPVANIFIYGNFHRFLFKGYFKGYLLAFIALRSIHKVREKSPNIYVKFLFVTSYVIDGTNHTLTAGISQMLSALK